MYIIRSALRLFGMQGTSRTRDYIILVLAYVELYKYEVEMKWLKDFFFFSLLKITEYENSNGHMRG